MTAFMKGFIVWFPDLKCACRWEAYHPGLLTEVTAVYTGILIGNAASGGCSQRFGRREMIVLSQLGLTLDDFRSGTVSVN